MHLSGRQHIAPEMLSGNARDVDARTDVYLLGTTLHHILTGEVRHKGDSIRAVLYAAEVSEPYRYDSKIPKILADIVNQACHVNPEERIQSRRVQRAHRAVS